MATFEFSARKILKLGKYHKNLNILKILKLLVGWKSFSCGKLPRKNTVHNLSLYKESFMVALLE